MTVFGHGSADPRSLEKYDHLPPEQAIIRAWTDGDPSPRWHALAIRDVDNAMPLLARAVERLVKRELTKHEDEKRRRELADELKDDLFDYGDLLTGEEVPLTFRGEVVGHGTIVSGPGNRLEVHGTLTDKVTIDGIRGGGRDVGFVGHIPLIDTFLSDPMSLGVKRSRPVKPESTDQPEPSDPHASPQS